MKTYSKLKLAKKLKELGTSEFVKISSKNGSDRESTNSVKLKSLSL